MAYTYGEILNCKYGDGSNSSYYQCRLGYQVNSQNIENNTSNITLRLEVRSINSSYATRGYTQTSKIDGVKLSAKTFDMSDTNVWQVFGTRTITVSHNAEGVYSASKNASFTTTATGGYSLGSGNASALVNPPDIARASVPTLSSSNGEMGSSVTITTNRRNESFTHTLEYSFGNVNGTIATGVGANINWTPPVNLASQIPSAISGNCVITCKTYNDNTLVGTKTVNLTLKVPTSVKPSISSINISEANSAVPSSWGVYVQNKSKLRVITNASGSYGSTITGYKITGIDGNTYNSNNFVSGVLVNSGARIITVTVTDSRGRTATLTQNYNCVAYNNPSITSASAVRCNADGTENEEGTSVKYTFKASIAPVNNKNSHEYKIGYKRSTDSSYTYITIENQDYSLDKENVVIEGITFSEDNSYDFQFFVSDYFTSSAQTQSISTGFTLMDFNASGKSMAIGKASEASASEELLEIALDTEFSGEVFDKNNNEIISSHYVCEIDTDPDTSQAPLLLTKQGNVPINNNYFYIKNLNYTSNGIRGQIAFGYNSNAVYYRWKYPASNPYSDWAKLISNNSNELLTILNTIYANGGYLKTTSNGRTTQIGSQNSSFCHYSTDAPSHWFNKNVQVQGEIYSGPNYNDRVVRSSEIADSGWIDVSTFSNNFKSYSDGQKPRYRKIGKLVEVTGSCSTSANVATGTNGITMFTLPAGYRPSKKLTILCQGSGANKWAFAVNENGTCTCERYGTTGTNGSISSGSWLPFHVTFLID